MQSGKHMGQHLVSAKSRNYKERQVDEKYRKVFPTAHVVLRTAAMFLANALNRGHPPKILKVASNSWVSLGYFAVNVSGGQPKIYWWLCCTGVIKSHEVAHICCQVQGQHIQWKTISLRWLRIDLELTPSEIMTSRETQEYQGKYFCSVHWLMANNTRTPRKYYK